MSSTHAIQMIALERKRQIEELGFTEAHDDHHSTGQLLRAASCYMREPRDRPSARYKAPVDWPFRNDEWKPSTDDRERELIKAAALLCSEIDRLHRAKNTKS